MAGFVHQKTRNCHISIRFRNIQVQSLVQVAHRKATIEKIGTITLFDDLLVNFFIVFVRNISNYFFEKILKRKNSLDATMFVNDEAEVDFGFLHLAQDVLESCSIRHIERRLEDMFQTKCFRSQQIWHNIFAVDNADDVVQGSSINRKSRVPVLTKSLCYSFK